MSRVTISSGAFQRQEDRLINLATALDAISDRVQALGDIVKTSSDSEHAKLENETGDLWALLRCLSAVAESTGNEVTKWRVWAEEEKISVVHVSD